MTIFNAQPRSCTTCPLNGKKIVPGEFYSKREGYQEGDKADYIFIAQNPGTTEDKEGRPLIGKSGTLFRAMLEVLNYDKYNCYLANTVKCYSKETPDDKIIDNCLWRLQEEILKYGDKNKTIIVLLGQVATTVFLNPTVDRLGFMEVHGWKIFQTYHPAYILRMATSESLQDLGEHKEGIVKDWRRHFETILEGYKKSEYVTEFDKDKIQNYLSFDLETSGIDVKGSGYSNFYKLENPVLCMSMDSADSTQVLSSNSISTNRDELQDIFDSSTLLKIGHNLHFDMTALKTQNITVKNPLFDTFVASFLLSGQQRGGLGLKEHSLSYLYDAEALQKRDKDELNLLPEDRLNSYSAMDALATTDYAKEIMVKVAKHDKLSKLMQKVLMPALETLVGMEWNGAKIDLFKLQELDVTLSSKIRNVEERIQEHLGVKEFQSKYKRQFKPGSPKDVGDLLTDILQIETDVKTPKGRVSTREDDLEEMDDPSGFIDLLLEFRNLAKEHSTYVKNIPPKIDKNGLIHTTYSLTGTVTGRLSSSDPNLQNIPREGRSPIKDMFVSRFKDGKIISYDLSQVELRAAAGYSRDPYLVDAYKSGRDIHGERAREYFKRINISKEERSYIKGVNFGILYGQGDFGLARQLKCSKNDAKAMLEDTFKRMYGLKKWIDNTHKFAIDNGYVETKWGRRIALQIRQDNLNASLRQSINFPIQGQASDLLLFAMSWIWNEIEKRNMQTKQILNVHDCIIWDVPKEEVDDMIVLAEEGMNNITKYAREEGLDVDWLEDIPIIAEGSIGTCWGNLKEINA